MLGRIESGLYWEEVSDLRIDGTFADEGHPEFSFEAVLGDESFRERDELGYERFDNWRQKEEDRRDREGEPETDEEQPYEKVQVKIVFPKLGEFKNDIVVEKWVDWRRVHPEQEALDKGQSTDGKASTPPDGSKG
jgi:hypothetical protein